MFNVSGYGVYFSPNLQPKSPLRVVSSYEIELYCNACGTGFVNGDSFAYQQDRVCLFRPGQRRQSEGQFQCYYLKFTCDNPEIKKYIDSLPTQIPPGDSQRIYPIFHDIFDAMSQKYPGYTLYVSGKICEMISLLYSFTQSVAHTSDKYGVYNAEIFESIRFMRDHLADRITLEDIAGSVHLSPSFFHVVFKKIMQKTPHRYLLEVRLATAKDLLVNSNLALAVIAEKCGFDSQVYFNYIVKKEWGVTPKKYRDAHRNKHYSI